MNNYDDWKAGNYETERDAELYTEEQILLEQIDSLESKLKEAIRSKLWLIDQLKTLATLNQMESTFGTLSIEEQKQKIEILKRYETI